MAVRRQMVKDGKSESMYIFIFHGSPFPKEVYFLEGPQASPICPSGNSKYVDEVEYGALWE